MGDAVRRSEESYQEIEPALRRFVQEAAWVEEIEGDALRVRSRSGAWRAVRAKSCLVEPVKGDKALIARSDDGAEAYVLAILDGPEASVTNVAVGGELRVSAQKVEIAGKEGIRLLTPADLEAAAHKLRVQAEDATMLVKSLAYLGKEIASQLRVVKVAGATLDATWESVRQHARSVYRTVSETEQVRAESFDVRCDNHLTLHADSTAVTAKQLVKMDAGQIVMG